MRWITVCCVCLLLGLWGCTGVEEGEITDANADLFSIGTDKTDGTQADLFVHTGLLLTQTAPPCTSG